MQQGILGALVLLDTRGYVILGAIVVTLVTSIVLSVFIRSRYAGLAADLREHTRPDQPFSNRVLTRMLEDARNSQKWQGRAADHQASIEQHFQSELGGLLLGERFVRAAPGLVIIFGLMGTFYGLSLSIGKLVLLVAGGDTDINDVGASMTQGLTHALSGMSVAFSASLFGIAAAVVLTLFGIFLNVSDRRTALMINIETHLERVLGGEGQSGGQALAHGGSASAAELDQVVAEFARTVTDLRDSVGQFDMALQGFATTTRDFREFNLHLKDNVQRMSLSFADLSETLKTHSVASSGRIGR